MKQITLIFSLLLSSIIFGQDNTKVLDLLNFARTNPKAFSQEIAEPFINENDLQSSRYSKSLLRVLKSMKPLDSLKYSNSLEAIAINYAEKAGKMGWTDHRSYNSRFSKVKDEFGLTAENLDFGSIDEIEIVMDLLIDEDIPSLGHRKNILDKELTHVGFGFASHKKWEWIFVMDFGAELN